MSSALSSSKADGPGDTTLFIATAASKISDGPTLPIIGGSGEQLDWAAADAKGRSRDDAADQRLGKKQRTEDDLENDSANLDRKSTRSKPDVEGLYQPWTLLPAEVLQQVEKRMGAAWTEKVDVVVWTKNQNVKSGINRLKSLLGFEDAPVVGEQDGRRTKETGDAKLVAISAYGEGSTKLVGIVEMTKRVVGGGAAKEGKDVAKENWFMYTLLSSTVEKDVKNPVPVLTVWFSPKSLPELKRACGEQSFQVVCRTVAD